MVLLRPLLGVTRAETEILCNAFGVNFVEDPANQDLFFLRNRVRKVLVPLLRNLNPAVDSAICRLATTVGLDLEILDAATMQALTAAECSAPTCTNPAKKKSESDHAGIHVNRIVLCEYPIGLQRRVLRAWVERAGVTPISEERTEALQRLAERGGGVVELGGGVNILASGPQLTLQGVQGTHNDA
jgi:tRNA(Ile)-lysidine synthase